MDLSRRTLLQGLGVAATGIPSLGNARSDYPTRSVQISAPFSAGGPLDAATRALARALQDDLGQPFVVVNKPGASGNIGAAQIANSDPDGYALLMTPDTSIAANPVLYGERMGFDPERDLEMIAAPMTFGQMLVVHPSVPVRTLPEFVAYARDRRVNYGSAGVASPGHLTMEQLALQTGIQVTHIPYKGMSQALVDILSGEVSAGFLAAPGVIQHVTSNKLVALAVSGEARSPLAPDLPTVAESGVPQGTMEFFYVLMAPRGTPEALRRKLNERVRAALGSDAVRSFMKRVDFRALDDTVEQASARLAGRRAQMQTLIRARKIALS